MGTGGSHSCGLQELVLHGNKKGAGVGWIKVKGDVRDQRGVRDELLAERAFSDVAGMDQTVSEADSLGSFPVLPAAGGQKGSLPGGINQQLY